MDKIISLLFVTCFSLYGRCDFVSYFEVKLEGNVIFNSTSSTDKVLRLERAALSELDLMEVAYYECGVSEKNEYELQLHSPNKENEVIFASDEAKFTFHMSWMLQRQFIGKQISVSLLHKKYTGSTFKEYVHTIFDVVLF